MADINKYLGANQVAEIVRATQLLSVIEQKAILDSLATSSNLGLVAVSTITTAAYTASSADLGSYLRHTYNGAKTLSVPGDATFGAADIGTRLKGRVANTGSLTISGTAGATVNAPTTTNVVTANGTYDLVKVAANTWDLFWSN